MRWLEVRRHSLTKKGEGRGQGSHLSADGVALARRVGADLGPMARVVTSPSPRAVETAVAMGYAVDRTVDLPSGYVVGEIDHHDQWGWPRPFERYAELIATRPAVAAAAQAQLVLWSDLVTGLVDGECALLVSHGGSIELPLVAAVPHLDRGDWGAPFAHCDGVRLGFDGTAFVEARLDRADRLR